MQRPRELHGPVGAAADHRTIVSVQGSKWLKTRGSQAE